MKPYQAIGYTLLNTSAITAITSSRVYHGLRPIGTTVPSINYYEVGNGTRYVGLESKVYSVNCRATTPNGARDLADLVIDTFHGSSGTGITGHVSGSTIFEIARSYMQLDGGLIPEIDDNIYNAPIDIRIIYPTTTVS